MKPTVFNEKTFDWKAWNISNTQKVQRCSCPDFLPRSKNLFWLLGFKSIRLSPTILSLAEWTSSSIRNTQYPLNINWRCGTLMKYVWSRTHQLRKQRQKLKINSIQGFECAITFSENHRTTSLNFTTKDVPKCQNLNILMVETFRNWNCFNDLKWKSNASLLKYLLCRSWMNPHFHLPIWCVVRIRMCTQINATSCKQVELNFASIIP